MNEQPSLFRPNLMPVDSLMNKSTETTKSRELINEPTTNPLDVPSSSTEHRSQNFAKQAVIFIRGKIGRNK